MKQTINQYDFINAFQSWDTYKNHFSYDGLVLLYEYFEDCYADTDIEMELDVVGICCDFSEMSLEEVISYYTVTPLDQDMSEGEQVECIADYLSEQTSFIGYTDDKTFVFAQW